MDWKGFFLCGELWCLWSQYVAYCCGMFGVLPAGLGAGSGCHTDSGAEPESGPGAGQLCHPLEAGDSVGEQWPGVQPAE